MWYVRGGRGAGKTRTGSETLAGWILDNPPGQWAIVAPTYADARDICVEGPSGLLRALGASVESWNRSQGEVLVHGGSTVKIAGGDDGALRIQGYNLRGAWCDEVGLWERWQTAWQESIGFAVRMDPARIVATGTPKQRNGLVRLLMESDDVIKTHMRTMDNVANLHDATVKALLARYEGTRLGRQELEGELLTDVPGALWTTAGIEAAHKREQVNHRPEIIRAVVSIDPAVTAGEDSDDTGIIVAGLGVDGHGYVLADRTCKLTPKGWALRAVAAYDDFEADLVVAEVNNGGDLVGEVIWNARPTVPYRQVRASRGKRVRAEPVSMLYEQGRVHHMAAMPELEEQLLTWTPESGESPDRLDALVWALTELMIDPADSDDPGFFELHEEVRISPV